MKFLGIDPGLRITGYGCVEETDREPRLVEAGVIRLTADGPRRTAPMADRLAELDADLAGVLARLRPGVVAVESLFAHGRHPATAIAMAHARGVILLNVRRAGLPLVELKPNEVKKFLTGHGHADKQQIQDAVRDRLRLARRPEPPDVADAIAIALCAACRSGAGGGPVIAPATPARGRRARS